MTWVHSARAAYNVATGTAETARTMSVAGTAAEARSCSAVVVAQPAGMV